MNARQSLSSLPNLSTGLTLPLQSWAGHFHSPISLAHRIKGTPVSSLSLIVPQLLLRPDLMPSRSLHSLVYVITAPQATVHQQAGFSSWPQHLSSSVRLQHSWMILPEPIISWWFSPASGSSLSWPGLALNFGSTLFASSSTKMFPESSIYFFFKLKLPSQLLSPKPPPLPAPSPRSRFQLVTSRATPSLLWSSQSSASSYSHIPQFKDHEIMLILLPKSPQYITALIFTPPQSSSCHFSCPSVLNFPVYPWQCLQNHLPKWHILPCHLLAQNVLSFLSSKVHEFLACHGRCSIILYCPYPTASSLGVLPSTPHAPLSHTRVVRLSK